LALGTLLLVRQRTGLGSDYHQPYCRSYAGTQEKGFECEVATSPSTWGVPRQSQPLQRQLPVSSPVRSANDAILKRPGE
jgi:hypothetical protein